MNNGGECTHCGECCTNAVCGIGLKALGVHAPPCKALMFDGEMYHCMVVREADNINGDASFMIRLRLGIGAGCCSS